MRKSTLWGFVIGVVFLAGCGPYEGPVLNANNPKRLIPCQKPASDDRALLSYSAMNAVLARNGWFIVSKSLETKTIDARKCKNSMFSKSKQSKPPMERPQAKCLDLRFSISSSGAVTLINPPERRFYWRIEPDVQTWIEEMEFDYVQVRCYDSTDLAFWRQSGD